MDPVISPPTGNGRVLIRTTRGDIDIILHPQKAREHCTFFMDWVMSMLDEETTPCYFQRVIQNFYIQFNLDEAFKERHQPNICLHGMKFDRPGLCAFNNQSPDQFIITLDPCDGLNHKYSIFGEVSAQSAVTLQTINELEADEDVPDERHLITGIEILEYMANYSPSQVPDNELSHDELNPYLHSLHCSLNILEQDINTNGINSDTKHASTNHTPSAPIPIPSTPMHNGINGHSPSTPSLNTPPSTPVHTGSSLSRSSSSVFHVPSSPKRQKLDVVMSPKGTPSLARSTTLMLDQQQVLMSSHYASAMNANFCSMARPPMARSFSTPDMRMKFQPKWPKRLVIVRHGQSEQNACLDLYQDDIDTLLALASVRDCDIKLTEFGAWQAEQTGKYLANSDQFDICFVSPYHRAVKTAELISKELPYKLKIYKDNWLREKEFGRLHGLNEKTVRQKFPLEYEIRNRDGKYWYRFPGGENYCDVEMRIHCFLEKLSRDYAGRSVLVVTHQVPYKLFRALLQHLDEDGVLKLEAVHNCGVQEYLLDRMKSLGGRLKLKTFNFVAYKMSECPQHLTGFTKNTE